MAEPGRVLSRLEERIGRAERGFASREKTTGVVDTVKKEIEGVKEALRKCSRSLKASDRAPSPTASRRIALAACKGRRGSFG